MAGVGASWTPSRNVRIGGSSPGHTLDTTQKCKDLRLMPCRNPSAQLQSHSRSHAVRRGRSCSSLVPSCFPGNLYRRPQFLPGWCTSARSSCRGGAPAPAVSAGVAHRRPRFLPGDAPAPAVSAGVVRRRPQFLPGWCTGARSSCRGGTPARAVSAGVVHRRPQFLPG